MRPFAQFEHVAQQQNPSGSRFEGYFEKMLDGGPHARRVGIVTIDYERITLRFDPLRAVVVGRVTGNASADTLFRNAEPASDRDGSSDVESVVISFELAFEAVGNRGCILLGMKPRMFGRHFGQHGVFCADECPAARVVEKVEQLPFAAAHPLGTAESFQMAASDVGEKPVVGFGYGGQSGDFTAGAGTHFDDADLYIGSHREKCERYADEVVEVASGGINRILFGQHAADEFFGRRFAVAARNGDDGDAQCTPVFTGQILQGLQRVVYEEHARVGGCDLRVVDHRADCAFGECIGGEPVAVERCAAQGEENRIRFDTPCIGRNVRMFAEKGVKPIVFHRIRYVFRRCCTSLRR